MGNEEEMRILFDSKDLRYKSPFGTVVPGEECRMTIYIPASVKTREVYVILEKENGQEHARFSMNYSICENEYEQFTARFSVDEPGLYFYYFNIETENEEFDLFKEGYDGTNMEAGDKWQLSCIPSDFKTPEYLSGSVMYQIFPDRFFAEGDVDLTGKMQPFWIHENKYDNPVFAPDENGEVRNCDFYGGNIRGIISKLDYLKELGVRVIYLNPIFKAWSNHRYDTADYKRIDEMLGNEDDFRKLCEAAHERDMKIILDGVFSHTGSRSIYFDSENEFGGGAAHDPSSKYVDWFEFEEYPDKYTSWWGVKTLPCVREMNEDYRKFVVDDDDSVIAHWIRAGADGFRLDVADELPDEFISFIRKRLKKEKDGSLLIGEVWEDASNKSSYGKRRTYFTEGELDSVMNYPFRSAIIDFVTGFDNGLRFRDTVMSVAENYPPQVLNLLMNLLSTHDTPRIYSVLSPYTPPESKEARANYHMSDDEISIASERYLAAAFIQFVLPGMPCIYYGDEIGMEGFEDPLCRKWFRWDKVDNNRFLSFFRSISKIRNEENILKKGYVHVETEGHGVVTIDRELMGETVRAVVNISYDTEGYCPGQMLFSKNLRYYDSITGKYELGRYGFILVKKN